jgi:DNA-binding NarL/FixJ family response regulator
LSSSSDQFAKEAERIATLTARERSVCVLVAEGLTNRQASEKLGITPVTVRHHLSSAFRKLEVANRFELIILWLRHAREDAASPDDAGPP